MQNITPINQQTQTEIENSNTHAPSSEDVQIEDDGLTYKERLFIDAYLGEAKGNATQAIQIAGYAGSYQTQRRVGSDLLTKPHILAHIRAGARAVMGEHEAIEHLADIIRASDWQYAQEYKDKYGETVAVKINYTEKVKALELLLKYHGALTDKVEHSGTVQQQVTQVIAVLHPDGMTTIDSTATETQTDTNTHTDTHNNNKQ